MAPAVRGFLSISSLCLTIYHYAASSPSTAAPAHVLHCCKSPDLDAASAPAHGVSAVSCDPSSGFQAERDGLCTAAAKPVHDGEECQR